MKRYLITFLLTLCTSAVWANDYFLKIDGIDGESTRENFEKWIDINAFSWGVVNPAASPSGGGAGKASFSDLSWSQMVDKSVVPIFLGVASGKHYKDATLSVVGSGETQRPFFQMVFKDAQLTSLQTSGGGDALQAMASLAASS
ncbi:MAG TPA: type VI secretion system tube protein Hcp, partial [Roseateles sp.]|nr:type VI secretion system tube protein Hcp [Roseateles sp.]